MKKENKLLAEFSIVEILELKLCVISELLNSKDFKYLAVLKKLESIIPTGRDYESNRETESAKELLF